MLVMSKIDMKRDEKRFRYKLNRKPWRDYRLRELEKQLEFAESRCGTLKQQLDYIKILYGREKPSLNETEEISEFHHDEENARQISHKDLSKWKKLAENRTGDTKEKNFLPDVGSYTDTTRGSSHSSNKPISSKSSFEKKEMLIINRKDTLHRKACLKLTKGKRKKIEGNSRNRIKGKGTEPEFNNIICQTLCPIRQDPVVEIYKNSAANIESESAANIIYKNSRQKVNNLKSDPTRTNTLYVNCEKEKRSDDSHEKLVPATKLNAFTSFKSLEKVPLMKEEGVQTESLIDNKMMVTIKTERSASGDTVTGTITKYENPYCNPEPVKSYFQPTISSKKKRVERNFLTSINNLHLKNIPFIAATSTAPSHNIGVNIQQVLSIMRKRQANINNIFPILSDHGVENRIQTGSRIMVNEANEGNTVQLELSELNVIESKKHLAGSQSKTSQKKTTNNGTSKVSHGDIFQDDSENSDWVLKVHKLKKVLVFLHEDFSSLSQKYKRLQKKLSKRNINKTDAKGELAEIERDLEKKEEEITTVIGLYKELLQRVQEVVEGSALVNHMNVFVLHTNERPQTAKILHLRDEVKKYQEKYNCAVYERSLIIDGIKQSNSTHAQMSSLLRKIQQFQDQLKR